MIWKQLEKRGLEKDVEKSQKVGRVKLDEADSGRWGVGDPGVWAGGGAVGI